MPLSSRGHRRACDQDPVVKKRDPLVRDRDDDLERALRRGLGPSASSQIQSLSAGGGACVCTERIGLARTCVGAKTEIERVRSP